MKEVVDLVKRLCNSMKFFGVINTQFILDRRDMEPKLIEINPRVGGGVSLCVAAGFNLPLNAVYLALGKLVEKSQTVPCTLYMTRYHQEIFITHPFAVESIHT